jgi:hypothetical protein
MTVFRRRAVALLVGVALLALTPALAGRRNATVSAAVTGPDVGSQQPSIAWESTAQMNADLDAMVAAGMTWIRADFYWSAIELQQGHFSWTATDTFVHAATARGLRILALPDYTPSWARSGPTDKYPPRNPADFATFVRAAAQRYAPMGVHAWEIWNEPNNAAFWAPSADPVAYTTLLKLAYAAIKSADPSASVVTGGLSPAADNGRDVAPLTFVTQMYAHGARGSFDAVGYHPYSYPYAPMYSASWNTFFRTPDLYALMARNGDGAKRVWGTEVGFPTGTATKAVTEATQAAYIGAAIDQWSSWSFHGPIMFYTIRDLGTDPLDVNDNMGMVNRAGAPKAVFASVRRQLQAPRDVHATPASGAADVTWSPPPWDYGRPITGYTVIASSGATATVSGSARSVTFALGDGIAARFSVVPLRESEAGVTSDFSNWVTPGTGEAMPSIVPGVASVKRPRVGAVTMRIPVRLSVRSTHAITVHYATASAPPTVNARPGVDYTPRSGTLSFAAGQTLAFIPVTIRAHNTRVPNDVFLIKFANPISADLAGYYGLGIGFIAA